ncbi:MAG: FAD-binding oxidoreductase [Anaerolineae bacterium]|nr:FAD-binding oxidoreductase [Anaerolineae bacterium]
MSANSPYDVVIVGAGLSGALVASTLAAEGQQVVVLEAAQSLGGTVRRQPGLALLGTPTPFIGLIDDIGAEKAHTLWELTSDNLVRLEILLDQLGVASEKPGSLRLATDSRQSELFRASAEQLQTYGYDVALEDGSQYEELVALSTHDDIVFDPQDLISRLLDQENIILELGAEVYATSDRPDGSVAVWAHNQYLWADKVIFANGIHATRFNSQLAAALQPVTVHTVVFNNVKEPERPLVLDTGHICFLPYQDRGYLTGWGEKEDDLIERLGAVAEQLCPDAVVHERFTTRIACTADHLPVVGQLPGAPNITFVNGLGPFGLNLAMVATEELAALVLEDRAPELFSLERFANP